jgi:hypothetical protein
MTTLITPKKAAEFVGEIIENDIAERMIDDFKKEFPKEVSQVEISVETIFRSVENVSNVSGIRFMYGLESSDDPLSRVIVLIPCNNTSTHLSIPNSIIMPEGYLTHNGKRVSLKRTWELLFNHAVHYSTLLKEVKFNRIVRGDFVGIESLKQLCFGFANAKSISYYFGYDKDCADLPFRNKSVLQPKNETGIGFDIYMDFTRPCPPYCSDDCIISKMVQKNAEQNSNDEELNIYRGFRDRYLYENILSAPLVEMYYYISPVLIEAIQQTGKEDLVYSEIYFGPMQNCNDLIANSKFEEAKLLFEETINSLLKKYVFI